MDLSPLKEVDYMHRRKTAVLLFDRFSNYEMSVALSVLAQGGKAYDIFCKSDVATSEEGIVVRRTKALENCQIDAYDSLLIPGCMDLRDVIDDEAVLSFLREFDAPEMKIASISSSPLLLFKANLIHGRKYMAGLVKEELLEEGFAMEQLTNMRDITELKNEDGTVDTIFVDGNLLTGIGIGFVEFGIQFGKMLNLEFEPQWYGLDRA